MSSWSTKTHKPFEKLPKFRPIIDNRNMLWYFKVSIRLSKSLSRKSICREGFVYSYKYDQKDMKGII